MRKNNVIIVMLFLFLLLIPAIARQETIPVSAEEDFVLDGKRYIPVACGTEGTIFEVENVLFNTIEINIEGF